MSTLCKQPINRRSFLVRLAGFFALFFVSPVKAVASKATFTISAGSAVVDGKIVTFQAFTELTARAISEGLGVPFELLVKEFSKTNYSSARTDLMLYGGIGGPDKRRLWTEKV